MPPRGSRGRKGGPSRASGRARGTKGDSAGRKASPARSKGSAGRASSRSGARKTGSRRAASAKGSGAARSRASLPQRDLSLHYHILKLLVGSIFRAPEERINAEEVLSSTRDWLIVTPFSRPKLRAGLEGLSRRRLLRPVQRNGRKYYEITSEGRAAYRSYREVMTLWRVEKLMGERLKLYTVSEILPRRSTRERDYIPDECFIDWPLRFQPVLHRFEGRKEVRVFDAFEKVKR